MGEQASTATRPGAPRNIGRRRRYVTTIAVVAAAVATVSGVAAATGSSTSEGIVPIAPHTLYNATSLAAGKSLSALVSGGATTVPTDATRVQFSVSVSKPPKAGSLTAQPYLDPADASGDTLSWQAAQPASDTFLEPVGVSNKVSFTNTSAGAVTLTIKIIGYSTSSRLAARLDTVENNQRADEQTITALINTVSQQASSINSLSARLGSDETTLQALKRKFPGTLTVTGVPINTSMFNIVVAGANLLPGSFLSMRFVNLNGVGSLTGFNSGVASDGTFSSSRIFQCGETNIYVSGTDMYGAPITSNTVASGPGCS